MAEVQIDDGQPEVKEPGSEEKKQSEPSEAEDGRPKQNKFLNYAKKETRKQSEAEAAFKRNLQRYAPADGFLWPDDRVGTEKWILQLKEKQILLIRGVASEWVNWAPQRMAMVLQSGINRLWPGCEGVYRWRSDEKLSFGFWRDFEKFERPVIIVVPAVSTLEFLHNFIYAGWEKAYYDLKEELRSVNIFLILQIPDDIEEAGRLRQGEEQRLYASWMIPTVRLELRRQKGPGGDKLFERIKRECGLSEEDDPQLYATIREEHQANDEELINIIRTEIQEKNVEWQLMEKAFADDTELKLRLIYCVAFFNDMNHSDLGRIMSFLLKDKVEEIYSSTGSLLEKKPLKDKWSKPLLMKRLIADCQIRVQDVDKISCVKFMRQIRYERIKKIFLDESLLFFLLTEELIFQDVLFDQQLSERIQISLARAMVLLIGRNYTTYDGHWLVKKANDQLNKFHAALPEEMRRQMHIQEADLDVSFDKWRLDPIKHLLRELLLSGREELIRMVKVFFEQLIGSSLKKKAALGLAVDLFRELRGEGNFPEEDLDQYFKHALENSPLEEKFDIYWLMIATQNYKDLFRKTTDWISTDEEKAYPWTVRFSRLYLLDYFALSFYQHFQVNAEKKDYELLTGAGEEFLPAELSSALREITGDEALKSWKVLMEEYDDLFALHCYQLENTVTGLEWIRGRTALENCDVLTLAGDIIENWFYILFREGSQAGDKQLNDKMRLFVRMLSDNIDGKKLQLLKNYWIRKANQLYPRVAERSGKEENITEKETKAIKEKLNLRSISLRLMTRKENALIN